MNRCKQVVPALLFALVFSASCLAQSTPMPAPDKPKDAAEQVDADDLDVQEAEATGEDGSGIAAEAAPAADGKAESKARFLGPPERASGSMNPAPADPSLLPVYKDFGEQAGLVALMDDFMARLVADPRTNKFFAESDQASIKKHLVEQFCVILGGPCSYTGRDMKTVHAGFDIHRGQFNALVEDLQKAMDARRIPFRSQNRLLAKLAPMHREIETR